MNGTTNLPVRVLIVLGTRPEAIKLIPVVRILEADERFDVKVILTGQHRELVDQILGPAGIEPDFSFEIMRHDQTLSDIEERVIPRLDRLYMDLRPALVLVQGDTTSAACAAMTAYHRGVPVGHIEAGLRSHDRFHPFPEEMNRRVITAVADLHFTPTADSAANLRHEGIAGDTVFVTGNTVVDALLAILADRDRLDRHAWNGPRSGNGPLVLMTVHRRESWGGVPGPAGHGEAPPLSGILSAVRDCAEAEPQVDFVFPVHPNPRVRKPARRILGRLGNVHLLGPQTYESFIELMTRATVVLTDSGGIQEEAPTVGVPVLIARRATERPEGLASGLARLVGTDRGSVRQALAGELSRPPHGGAARRGGNPFGDGLASERIRQAILHYFGLAERPATYTGSDRPDPVAGVES